MSVSPVNYPNSRIRVLSYAPHEGESGLPIAVRIQFPLEQDNALYVRLLIANEPLATRVTRISPIEYTLHASIPPFDHQNPSTSVCMSVQAFKDDTTILDCITFGNFTYWNNESQGRPSITKLPRLQIPDSTPLRRHSAHFHTSTPSPTMSDRPSFPKSPQYRTTRLRRRMKTGSLFRTKHANFGLAEQDDSNASTPILELTTPLASMCADWSKAERKAGRRLVRFTKVQDGRRLIVTCEPIRQEDYRDSETVISCINRDGVDACYVTSVDVIYLLERLTSGEFPVEEKNRIRRNLEGLKPTTVSKHKPGFGDFFQRIMDFPDPRPRNIEKDLKVFEWNLLGQALEKILSKYSVYTSDLESTDSSPVDTPDSPELSVPQISYPPPDDPRLSRFLDQQVNLSSSGINDCFSTTLDSLSVNCLENIGGAGSTHTFPSPIDSTTSSASMAERLPIAGIVEGGEPQDQDVSSWGATGLNEFTSFTALEAMEPFPGYDCSALDYTFDYEAYAFGELPKEGPNMLGDQYM